MARRHSPAAQELGSFKPVLDDTPGRIPAFDTLTATAESLQKALTAGTIKSTQIIEEYHRSIAKHNGYLNAVSQLAPNAMDRARELDDLRFKGVLLGPLHGIPILLKDSINTDPSMRMHASGGAVALLESRPSGNAAIVDKLLQAGMIILGKATMSELGFYKGTKIRAGWSAVHGQSQSAYVRGGLDMNDSLLGHSSPGGSSSGSAIAVSAGLAPLAIGTETFGSLVVPANRAALYTIKSTLGIIPGDGIVPISREYDTAGPMAKSPKDVADLLTILVDPSKTSMPAAGYAVALSGADWGDMKVGTLDPRIWRSSSAAGRPLAEVTEQMVKETNEAYAKTKTLAKSFHENLSDKHDGQFMVDGKSTFQAKLAFTLEEHVNQYLASLKSSRVRSLRELVEWNKRHADQALTAEYPNQDLLIEGLQNDHDPAKLRRLNQHLQNVGTEFMRLFDDYDIDIILAPGDSGIYNFSACCGFPIAALPLSCLDFNGRPFGLIAAARPHQEAMLVKVMGAWEKTFGPRPTPEAFLEGILDCGAELGTMDIGDYLRYIACCRNCPQETEQSTCSSQSLPSIIAVEKKENAAINN